MEPIRKVPTAEEALLHRAILLAVETHAGQRDLAGLPYIYHPLRVMNALPFADLDGRIVAVLHDVIEDCDPDNPVTLDDLRRLGYPERIVAALDCMTKRKGEKESWEAYLTRIKGNDIATRVKLADMADNGDPKRLGSLAPKRREKLNRQYTAGLSFLTTGVADFTDTDSPPA